MTLHALDLIAAFAHPRRFYERARSLLHTALTTQPDEPKLLTALGSVEGGSGKVEEARRLFQAATIADPRLPAPYGACLDLALRLADTARTLLLSLLCRLCIERREDRS